MAKRKPSPQTQWIAPSDGRRQKLPAKTPRDTLDELIDWYEKYKPGMEHVMPGGVAMTPDDLNKFAAKKDDDTWLYRGWELHPAEIPLKATERMKINK